jgi:hypothetical protein
VALEDPKPLSGLVELTGRCRAPRLRFPATMEGEGTQQGPGLDRPRSVGGLISAAFALYVRYPVLFLVLAGGVIVPYELIVLAATGTGSFSRSLLSVGVSLLLSLLDWVLIGPLVSALHVHAVADVRQGREPQLGPVALRGLRVLPVVSAAAIISGLGIGAGFLLFVIPGLILLFRWAVVAQAAAIEHEGWLPALRSSGRLVSGNYLHVIGFAICIGVLTGIPNLVGIEIFGSRNAGPASFAVGLCLHTLTASFAALATALLYFDLVSRNRPMAATTHPG